MKVILENDKDFSKLIRDEIGLSWEQIALRDMKLLRKKTRRRKIHVK